MAAPLRIGILATGAGAASFAEPLVERCRADPRRAVAYWITYATAPSPPAQFGDLAVLDAIAETKAYVARDEVAPPFPLCFRGGLSRYAAWFEGLAGAWLAKMRWAQDLTAPFFARATLDVLVFFTSLEPATEALLFGARSRGIPVVSVQHGMYALAAAGTPLSVPDTHWHDIFPFDAYAAWGPAAVRELVRAGYPPSRILEVGCQLLDRIEEHRQDRFRHAARQRLGLEDGACAVLLASTATAFHQGQPTWVRYPHYRSEATVEAWYRIIFEGVEAVEDAVLLVRNHPAYPVEKDLAIQRRCARRHDRVRWLDRFDDVWPALAAADIVVTDYSTTGLLGWALPRPLIVVRLPDPSWRSQYEVCESVPVATSPAEMAAAVRHLRARGRALSSSERRFLEDEFGSLEGGTGERLLENLERISRRDRRAI